MARKKRRGRPPGSKNKRKFGGSVGKMDVAQLSAYIASLRKTLAVRVEQQRDYFQRQLAELGMAGGTRGRGSSSIAVGRARTRRKAAPKYQSKKDKSLKWSGRGMTPVWMRDEMRGTKLKKDDFLIK
jgi:DNA-binding protein H-NS